MSPLPRLAVALLLCLLPSGLKLRDPSPYWEYQPGTFHAASLGWAPHPQATGGIPYIMYPDMYTVNLILRGLANQLYENEMKLKRQSEELQRLQNKTKMLEEILERHTSQLQNQTALLETHGNELTNIKEEITVMNSTMNQNTENINEIKETYTTKEEHHLLAVNVTSIEARLEENIHDVMVLNGTHINDTRQQDEQLQNLHREMDLMNNSLKSINERQTNRLDQHARQLRRLEENVTLINTDLANKTKQLNKTQAKLISQEDQLVEYKTALVQTNHKLINQKNLLDNQGDQLERILEMLGHLNASHHDNLAESALRHNDTLALLAGQELQIKNHSDDLWLLHDELISMDAGLRSINGTQITQERRLGTQAGELGNLANRLNTESGRLVILNRTQAAQQLQLDGHAEQLDSLKDNVTSISTDLEAETERLNALNVTQASHERVLDDHEERLDKLEGNVTSISSDLEEQKRECRDLLNRTQAGPSAVRVCVKTKQASNLLDEHLQTSDMILVNVESAEFILNRGNEEIKKGETRCFDRQAGFSVVNSVTVETATDGDWWWPDHIAVYIHSVDHCFHCQASGGYTCSSSDECWVYKGHPRTVTCERDQDGSSCRE